MKSSPGPWTRSRLDPNCIGFINDVIEPGKQSNFHAVAQLRERAAETEGNRALIEAAPDLLEACKLQHQAIDLLLAMLIEATSDFLPTKSAAWPALIAGNAAIKKAEGHS